MAYDVTLILGDGVGPELAEAARMCVDATGVKISWDPQEAGIDVMERTGTPLPEPLLASIRRTRCALKAPITTPVGKGFRSVNVQLRRNSSCMPASAPASIIQAFGLSSAACRSIWSSFGKIPRTCTRASNSRPARPRPAN